MATKVKPSEEIKPFKIEKGIVPTKQGRVAIYPKEFFRIKATMELMEREDSFYFPKNGFKTSSVVGWVGRIEKDWANEILDEELRKKSCRVFHKSTIKDADKNDIGVRIFRVR